MRLFEIEIHPCPKCGKPALKDHAHLSCFGKKPGARVTQQFDWTSHDGSQSITVDVSSLLDAMKAGLVPYQKIETKVDRTFAKAEILPMIKDELDQCKKMPVTRMIQPVLGIRMNDNLTLLADGSHRYMACVYHHRQWIRWHIVTQEDAAPYMIVTDQ